MKLTPKSICPCVCFPFILSVCVSCLGNGSQGADPAERRDPDEAGETPVRGGESYWPSLLSSYSVIGIREDGRVFLYRLSDGHMRDILNLGRGLTFSDTEGIRFLSGREFVFTTRHDLTPTPDDLATLIDIAWGVRLNPPYTGRARAIYRLRERICSQNRDVDGSVSIVERTFSPEGELVNLTRKHGNLGEITGRPVFPRWMRGVEGRYRSRKLEGEHYLLAQWDSIALAGPSGQETVLRVKGRSPDALRSTSLGFPDGFMKDSGLQKLVFLKIASGLLVFGDRGTVIEYRPDIGDEMVLASCSHEARVLRYSPSGEFILFLDRGKAYLCSSGRERKTCIGEASVIDWIPDLEGRVQPDSPRDRPAGGHSNRRSTGEGDG